MPHRTTPTREQVDSVAELLEDLARRLRAAEPSSIREFELEHGGEYDYGQGDPAERDAELTADIYSLRVVIDRG